jgi:type I restriction enzyme S subunit
MSSEWPSYKLGDCLLKIVDNRGKTPPISEAVTQFGLIEINAIVGSNKHPDFGEIRKYVTPETYQSWFRSGHPIDDDVLFSTVGSIAEVAIIKGGNGCIAQNLVGLRPNKKVIDPDYLYYILTNPVTKSRLRTLDISSVQPSIKVPHLLATEITVPDLQQQKQVVSILTTLDDRITLLRETNATLEAIAQALFKSWFVDFDPVRAKQEGRVPDGMDEATATLFHDSFEESELGLVPTGWRVGELGDLLSLRNERTKPTVQTATLPYVPIESISAKVPFLEDYKSGNEANSSLILFRKEDILFGAMRPYFHKVCIAPFDGVTRTTVFTLVSKDPDAIAFALFQTYQDTTIKYATQHSEGSTIPYAKWNSSLERMPIILPPKCIQKAFSNIVSSFIDRVNGSILQAQTLATLRDTLLPRLISGQLRLPEAEAMLEEAAA